MAAGRDELNDQRTDSERSSGRGEPGPVPPADRYPNVGRMAMAASHEGGLGHCHDVEFAFGLDLILDGLERLRG